MFCSVLITPTLQSLLAACHLSFWYLSSLVSNFDHTMNDWLKKRMSYVYHDGKIRCIKLQWVEQITTNTKDETTHERAIEVWMEAESSPGNQKKSSPKKRNKYKMRKWGETSSTATLILLPQSTLPKYHIVRRWLFDMTLAHRGTSCIGVCSIDINNRSWHHTTSSIWLGRYPFDTKISPFHILLVNRPSPKHLLDGATFNIAENSGLVVSSSNTG